MLIRKNTKAFKTILQLVETCRNRPDREKLIRLFITRAGHSVIDRISTEAIQEDSSLYYNMNYETVLGNLESSDRQLHISDEILGMYFFRSSLSKVWDESPFEFDPSIKNDFSSLPELPVTRKKEKTEKYVLPKAVTATSSSIEKTKMLKPSTAKAVLKVNKGPEQPDFKLKKQIPFTDLESIVFRQAKWNKQSVLNYYNQIAEYIVPYLKDRPLSVRLSSERSHQAVSLTIESLFNNDAAQLEWLKVKKTTIDKESAQWINCYDKEHVLLCVEKGCIEFNSFHSKINSVDSPDYIVLIIDSPDHELTKAIDVALSLKEILAGLQLPSFVKTDGRSGFHVYLPLISGSDFVTSKSIGEHICKLVVLKSPLLAAVESKGGSDSYGKVTLDYTLNEDGQSCIAPYSLVAVDGEIVNVATPLLWEEVGEDLYMEDFNTSTIFTRLKKIGDPFETLYKKKINADELLDRLKKNYAFLF